MAPTSTRPASRSWWRRMGSRSPRDRLTTSATWSGRGLQRSAGARPGQAGCPRSHRCSGRVNEPRPAAPRPRAGQQMLSAIHAFASLKATRHSEFQVPFWVRVTAPLPSGRPSLSRAVVGTSSGAGSPGTGDCGRPRVSRALSTRPDPPRSRQRPALPPGMT